jgi:hypothetical protein
LLTRERLTQVRPQRIKRKYAFLSGCGCNVFPNAAKIRIDQDKLNTHNTSVSQKSTADEARSGRAI